MAQMALASPGFSTDAGRYFINGSRPLDLNITR